MITKTFSNSLLITFSSVSINRHDADGISFKFPSRAHIIDLIGQLKSLSVGGKNLHLLSGVGEDKAQPPPLPGASGISDNTG